MGAEINNLIQCRYTVYAYLNPNMKVSKKLCTKKYTLCILRDKFPSEHDWSIISFFTVNVYD